VGLLDHPLLPMLFEEEADAGRREGRAHPNGVLDDRERIDELDGLERAPDLLPTSPVPRRMHEVDQGALDCRDTQLAGAARLPNDSAAEVRLRANLARGLDRHELDVTEPESAGASGRERLDTPPDRVGQAMEFERRVVREHSVVLGLRGNQIRIRNEAAVFASDRDGSVETSPHADEPSRCQLAGQDGVARVSAAASCSMGCDELAVGEYRVRGEE